MLLRLPLRYLPTHHARTLRSLLTSHSFHSISKGRPLLGYRADPFWKVGLRMASNDADANKAEANGTAPTENGNANLVPGPDGTMMTKTAAKKAQKELEKQAQKAAKDAIKAQRSENLTAASTGKKEKVKKEAKEEPKWVNNTVPGEKKGENSTLHPLKLILTLPERTRYVAANGGRL